MNKRELLLFLELEENGDYSFLKARGFEKIIAERLILFGNVRTQVKVPNRGDGRSGRIDIVFEYMGEEIGIEIDRRTPRKKSIFKVQSFNKNYAFVLTRSPFTINEYGKIKN